MEQTGSIGYAVNYVGSPGVEFLPNALYIVYCKDGRGLRNLSDSHYSPQALHEILPYINKPEIKAEVYKSIRSSRYLGKHRNSVIINEIRALCGFIKDAMEYIRLSWKIFKLKRGIE